MRPSADEYIAKMRYTYTRNSIRPWKNEILCFTTKHMSLEDIISCEVGQAHKDRYHMIPSCVETRDDALIEIVRKEQGSVERSMGRQKVFSKYQNS